MAPQPNKDTVFQAHIDRISDFAFNESVATVFDDMVSRSVPFYDEIQRMVVELAARFAEQDTNIYDLGCSTATTLALLHEALPVCAHLHGVDTSAQMLAEARRKLENARLQDSIALHCTDVDGGVQIENASVVMLVLTLQFVRPLNREKVVADIYAGLNDGGCLLLVEKVLGGSPMFNRLFIECYYDFKRRMGYSELEISQKREALENVLIPYRVQENCDLLRRCGFREVDVFFKWNNFAGFMAVK